MLSAGNDIFTVVLRNLHCKKRQGLTSTYSLSIDRQYFTETRSLQKPVPLIILLYIISFYMCFNEDDKVTIVILINF